MKTKVKKINDVYLDTDNNVFVDVTTEDNRQVEIKIASYNELIGTTIETDGDYGIVTEE